MAKEPNMHGMGPIVLTPAENDFVARSEVMRARGDLHHLISPIIGSMRLAGADDEKLEATELKWMVNRLLHALDVADALCGEKPVREQMDELRAEIAVRHAAEATRPGAE